MEGMRVLKRRMAIAVMLFGTCALMGCGIFPKEEELQRNPIIQAYQKDEFRMAKVQKGDLKLYERLEAVCMGIGEKQYHFVLSDLEYKGIYVKTGDTVTTGMVLAELQASTRDSQVANSSQLALNAAEDGIVTFAKQLEAKEKSVSGQLVVVTNSKDGYYLNAYTKYWDKFEKGMELVMRIRGEDYTAVVVLPEDIGLEEAKRPEDPEETSEVYFNVPNQELYMQSGDMGSVTILIEEKKNVLYVPESAITTVNDKEIVYVEDANGIKSVKYVETGLRADSKVEIVSGLQEGDSVILE